MAEGHTVVGRQFRTKADYGAALRGKRKRDAIKAKASSYSPQDVLALYEQMQEGTHQLELMSGNDFAGRPYGLVEKYKGKGAGRTRKNTDGKACRPPTGGNRGFKEAIKEEQAGSRKVPLKDFGKDIQKETAQELASLENSGRLAGPVNSYGERKTIVAKARQEGTTLPDVPEDDKTLYNKKKKLIGWLKIDDTIIDYPVKQGSGNGCCLACNSGQEKDNSGSIFIDKGGMAYPRGQNLILRRYPMESGNISKNWGEYAGEFYYGKHSITQLSTIHGKSIFRAIHIFWMRVPKEKEIVFQYDQFIDANPWEGFNPYRNGMAGMPLCDTGVAAEYGDGLPALSICGLPWRQKELSSDLFTMEESSNG